jgi:ethanolamine ammonia-lyase small subunit
VADGLSARAAQSHAAPLLAALAPRLHEAGWRLGPVVVALQARVALGDEIGALLGARLVLVLLGERPGLSAPDSLGAYLTWDPRPGRTDAERNCVSNIRAAGLVPALAADRLYHLMLEAARRRLSGVTLKADDLMLGA